jgi:hypothetical protein
MGFAGTFPQWVTFFVALGALIVAIISIDSQREVARKRAAVDFFTKMEMDKHTLDLYQDFKGAVKEYKAHVDSKKSVLSFEWTEFYRKIRDYLNLHELMAVGIKREVFDDYVCYDFWSSELDWACKEVAELITHIQTKDGEKETYKELVDLQRRWSTKGPGLDASTREQDICRRVRNAVAALRGELSIHN